MKHQHKDSTDKSPNEPSQPDTKDAPNNAAHPSADKTSDTAEREQDRQLESGEENPS